jgi:hypothetical protein
LLTEFFPPIESARQESNRAHGSLERAREENAKLQSENEMLRRVDAEKTAIIADLRRNFEASVRASDDRIAMAEAHFRERPAESERNKEIYLRFAVSINERLNSGIDQITAAREIAR